ncbi:gss, partial [Symbiodinium sp. CCMP2456]
FQISARDELKASALPVPIFQVAAMPQQSEAPLLMHLTEVPGGWPLATVIDAFAHLASCRPGQAGPDRAREAVSRRLVEFWASQPEEAEAWLERCRERFAKELAGKETRPEQLFEALLRHGAAELGKHGPYAWRLSEAGLLRGAPHGSAAQREQWAASYLQWPHVRDRCRELAERLLAAESPETARKRQKLEEETSERRRLEAELQKSQEECRDLRNRLAAAEAGLSSKEAELQAAQNESAECKEQWEELRCRARSAESALAETRQELEQVHERCADLSTRLEAAEVEVEHAKAQERLAHDATETQLEDTLAEMRTELQQAQDKHCKSQERCGDLAARLEVAEAGAVPHTRTMERLAEAKSDVVAKQVDLQQLQDESCGYQARRFPFSAEEGESKAELQLEKAVLQDRCEQLRQQLAKAEAKVDLLQGLREEIGMYKERLRGLERPVVETKKSQRSCGAISGRPSMSHPGPARSHVAFGDQESELAEQLGYNLVDEDRASVLSGTSSYSVKQDCFMLDAVFKSRMDFFSEGRDLHKGSQVLAGDGKTVLEVVEISKEGQATEVVDLQAGAATLRVTPDHPVQVPDEGGEAGRHLYMPAGKLKAGDFVMLDSGEPVALTSAETQPAECKVLKIVFKPDLPVAVFSSPSCILSKGHKKKSQVRRSGMGGRGKEAADPTDGGASIPDTAAGEYMDCDGGRAVPGAQRHLLAVGEASKGLGRRILEVRCRKYAWMQDLGPNLGIPDTALVQIVVALSRRLVELWAAQPTEAEAWLERCRERFAKELAGKETRPEELREALLRHGAAEWGKYGRGGWRFSEAGLLQREPRGSAAEQECRAAAYLQTAYIRDRCRELAERLGQAESQETARKRQKLEEETPERRRLEAELQQSQEEGRELRDRLAVAEAEVSSELQTAQNESAECKERCEEFASRTADAESALTEMRQELGQLQEEHSKCQERCEELLTRLEAEASQHAKTKERVSQAESAAVEGRVEVQRLQELQAAQRESAKSKTRSAAVGSATAEMQKELRHMQEEHGNCQEPCQELANRLQAAEVEDAETKRYLTHDATAKKVQPQQPQVQSCSCQARCFPFSSEEGSKAELQLEKAVLQDRCEQLRQQLAKAESKLDLLPALHEEIGMYKERLRGLERPVVETKRNQRLCGAISGRPSMSHPGPARSHVAFGDQESELAEQLGYSLVDEDVASVLSASSGYVVKENCFMLDAIFKSRMDFFREGRDLQKGSQVLAGDGKTVLEVVEISKEGQATEVVDLQAGAATLRVTPDHPVQVPDEGGEAGRHLYMPAGKLKAGDFVMLDSGEPVALTSAETQPAECKVLKIVFKPDLPVAVFSSPSCILSKGHKKKSQVRRAGGGKGKEAADPMDGGASIPDTAAGEYMD